MKPAKIILESGTLWKKITEQTQHALDCGALQSIATDYEFIEDGGIKFLVRIFSNIVRKEKAQEQEENQTKETGKKINPFFPYEEDLFVTNISETHLCLLNKYNIVPYHLLIITRAFEDQENWLNLNDFAALWACLREIDGLGFYNSGKIAGASQPHKHLQLVPLPLTSEGPKIPIEPVLETAEYQEEIGTISSFLFTHALAQLDPNSTLDPLQLAYITLENYYRLLAAVGLSVPEKSEPYNLLMTRTWMMVIPRSQASFESISLNSLGFAGALLVRDQQQMEQIKNLSPMTILKNVAR